MYKIGIIKETKEPSDARVVITPSLVKEVTELGFNIVIQRSDVRCFKDSDYEAVGATMVDNVDDCDILIGVKEVKKSKLLADKTYFFFSHSHKEQSYNRSLLQALVDKRIRMIDYEVLKHENGGRIIAFGKFAGMVGAHNALWTYNQRVPSFKMKRMYEFDQYQDAIEAYQKIKFPTIKIVLTGNGRVAGGAVRVLKDMGIEQVSPERYINETFDNIVFTQLSCEDYVSRKDGKPYDKNNFYTHPEAYKSIFEPYYKVSDIMINGIYWDNDAPVFFSPEDMKKKDFKIKCIADVTCDLAPVSSIPSTLYPTTITEPVFTYDIDTGKATEAFSGKGVDMMTIDYLPNELPKDASQEFGTIFVEKILPELLKDQSDILDGASLCRDGKLTDKYNYLEAFLRGE